MARTLSIRPVDGTFGAVVTGIKVSDLDEAIWRELYATWLQYALLIFPDQHLKRDEQIAFARRFGPLEFEMAAISNVKADGTLRLEKDNDDMMKMLKGNMGWHADFDLHARAGQGSGVQRRDRALDRRAHRLGRHARGLRCARSRHPHQGRRPFSLPFAALQPVQARPPDQERRRRSTAATASTTGRCRSGRW